MGTAAIQGKLWEQVRATGRIFKRRSSLRFTTRSSIALALPLGLPGCVFSTWAEAPDSFVRWWQNAEQ